MPPPLPGGAVLGRALLARAVSELRERGIRAVSLGVLSDNLCGRRVYEASSFAPVAGSERRFELGGRELEAICYHLN